LNNRAEHVNSAWVKDVLNELKEWLWLGGSPNRQDQLVLHYGHWKVQDGG
jgi:hypothetical protein